MEPLEIVAHDTVNGWIDLAVARIDEKFGDGFAKANPTLLSGYLAATATVYQRLLANDTGRDLISAVATGLEKVAG